MHVSGDATEAAGVTLVMGNTKIYELSDKVFRAQCRGVVAALSRPDACNSSTANMTALRFTFAGSVTIRKDDFSAAD